ncbi:MAG: DUF1178 family protein [Alphaproteobacteria bacterium]|nr:MAG: DUF1178 family protein [Alphaproteobacteria bacterium]
MIVFTLSCPKEHQFEGWFRSNADFEDQSARGAVSCPVCRSKKVGKALMAPNIATGGAIVSSGKRQSTPETSDLAAKIYDMAREVRTHVEENFEYVGAAFPEEARKAHKDEDTDRGIYGEATPQEVKALLEDGVVIAPLPDVPSKSPKKKLN